MFLIFLQYLYVIRIIIRHDVKYVFKINCYYVNYKKYFTLLGNHILHKFTVHIDKHNYYVL